MNMKREPGGARNPLTAAVSLLCAGMMAFIPALSGWQVPAMLRAGAETVLEQEEGLTETYSLVAHAMGQVDDYTGTNSLEAFQANYAKGYRMFEVDLSLTSDGYVVLRHDWSDGIQTGLDPERVPTRAEFLEAPIYGAYTPLAFGDALALLEMYPDIYLVTDTKETDEDTVAAQFTAMVEEAEDLGMVYLLDRVVVQIYTPEMQDVVEEIHHFPRYMLTLYQTTFYGEPDQFVRYAEACRERGISDIVIWHFLYDAQLLPAAQRYGLRVWLHTVNDEAQAERYRSEGAWGVYSDRIAPAG